MAQINCDSDDDGDGDGDDDDDDNGCGGDVGGDGSDSGDCGSDNDGCGGDCDGDGCGGGGETLKIPISYKPVQLVPFPVKPQLQSHSNEPTVLVQ